MKAKKGDFVRIHDIVLTPEERSANIPEDTRKVPLEMWVKGFIQEDGHIGEEVEVVTMTGRNIRGKLVEVNPVYRHSYGEFIPELAKIGIQARKILAGGDNDE